MKKLACDIFDTFGTHSGLVHDITDPNCWEQNGSTHGCVFSAFKLWVLTNCSEWVVLCLQLPCTLVRRPKFPAKDKWNIEERKRIQWKLPVSDTSIISVNRACCNAAWLWFLCWTGSEFCLLNIVDPSVDAGVGGPQSDLRGGQQVGADWWVLLPDLLLQQGLWIRCRQRPAQLAGILPTENERGLSYW